LQFGLQHILVQLLVHSSIRTLLKETCQQALGHRHSHRPVLLPLLLLLLLVLWFCCRSWWLLVLCPGFHCGVPFATCAVVI
jgi:hypothetical protein